MKFSGLIPGALGATAQARDRGTLSCRLRLSRTRIGANPAAGWRSPGVVSENQVLHFPMHAAN
jgi:hypothetical protein